MVGLMTTLGRLEKIELRNIWQTEDRDFTPWLAQEQNIAVLSEALAMDLEVEAQERNVGPFRADILCKDTHDSTWVLIENQLEKTDHIHLGQLLTYAAGLEAVTIVWISALFRDEHRAALDWLNDHTDEKIRFFGLEVELWRIGESPAAPKFNVVSKPNEWSRQISRASRSLEDAALTPTKELQLDYWTQIQNLLSDHKFLRPRKPYPQHWYDFAIGKSGINLTTTFNTRDRQLTVELYLGNKESEEYFVALEEQKEAIEDELGFELEWMRLPDSQAFRIVKRWKEINPQDESQWPRYHIWVIENLEKFYQVFKKRISEIRI